MALQVGTVDGLINLGPKVEECFVKAIVAFQENGLNYAKQKGISIGAAFQRFTYPVYSGDKSEYDVKSIENTVFTRTGKEQSPAFVTYCKKMGLVNSNESSGVFKPTELCMALYNKQITLQEYAYIIFSKQGVFVDGEYDKPLIYFISQTMLKNPVVNEDSLRKQIVDYYKDEEIIKTRFDIIIGMMVAAGIIEKVGRDSIYVLNGLQYADILNDLSKNCKYIQSALKDTDDHYAEYIGSFKYGAFDTLSPSNFGIYNIVYPNIAKYCNQTLTNSSQSSNKISNILPLQQIFYGAPGTGKSHEVKLLTGELDNAGNEYEKTNVFRTTFHPDTDYAAFVGCYKPTQIKKLVRDMAGKPALNDKKEETYEDAITYEFVPQVFTDAYMYAYNHSEESTYLVIEEINRGNCAQIFGDLFQLLDRKEDGFSEYSIKADKDLAKYLVKELGEDNEGIKDGKLRLPANLHILATMNTSDQSLFPMDSAFKRRWDWKYVPISYEESKSSKFIINVGAGYQWVDFIEKVNDRIFDLTKSEDKELGNFFIKNSVNADQFKNKVMFYLWNEVLRDEVENSKYFFYYLDNGDNAHKFTFKDLYGENADTILAGFLKYILKGAE